MKIHRVLGPGLLESAYRECIAYELSKHKVQIEKEKPMPVIYEEVKLNHGYRIDLLIENKIVVEIKSVDSINAVHFQQVLTYLKLGNYRLGIIINFNVASIRLGIKRIINEQNN